MIFPLFSGKTVRSVAAKFFKGEKVSQFSVNERQLPSYRYPDIARAAEAFLDGWEVHILDSEHQQNLNLLLNAGPQDHHWTSINTATRHAWPVGTDKEKYYSTGRFWLASHPNKPSLILRQRYIAYNDALFFEVASPDSSFADNTISEILTWSEQNSIFRNQILRLSFEPGKSDSYGDIEKPDVFRVLFHHVDPVTEDKMVVDDSTKQLLWRNVIDLHERREHLGRVGVPTRRGMLLYGPPGTGKTFACRYLAHALPNVTRIFVTGKSLTQVQAIFSLARFLKPSCVFLEDADLVFTSRDLTGHNPALGDLLDQMDGLREHDDITIILTTNSLERMEGAIKDRPGRISQCVYIGPPVGKLRLEYIRQFTNAYDCSDVDFDRLVEESDGATQAFIKEWVIRAVQIASERHDGLPPLKTDDFIIAMSEMKAHASQFGETLIGFRAKI